uniref:Putative secreted protein n=1 Tax=Anopheles marajoara TaxID=58244 RepID=A0A2M4CA33_9DIPT
MFISSLSSLLAAVLPPPTTSLLMSSHRPRFWIDRASADGAPALPVPSLAGSSDMEAGEMSSDSATMSPSAFEGLSATAADTAAVSGSCC